jgi:hypothetical protein
MDHDFFDWVLEVLGGEPHGRRTHDHRLWATLPLAAAFRPQNPLLHAVFDAAAAQHSSSQTSHASVV